MKSYTNIEQSRKLNKILPLGSADMYYCYVMDIYTKKWDYDITPTFIDESNQIDICDIPCWSLAALFNVLPQIGGIKPVLDLETNCIQYPSDIDLSITADNSVDACYEMILKLHKLELL